MKDYQFHVRTPGQTVAGSEGSEGTSTEHQLTVRPDGAGSSAQWSPVGGGNNWEKVDDTSPDEDTTRVNTIDSGEVDLYTQPGGVPLDAVNISVEVFLRGKESGFSDTVAARVHEGGQNATGSQQVLTTSYADYSEVFALAPDGGAWTPAKANAMEIGFVNASPIGALNVTQTWAVVTYSLVTEGEESSGGSASTGFVKRPWPDVALLPAFRWPINGGPSALQVRLPREWGFAGEIGETGGIEDLGLGYSVETWVIDDESGLDGLLLHSGRIQRYTTSLAADEGVDVTIIPFTSRFSDAVIEGPIAFTNEDPSTMMRYIVENFLPGVTWDETNPDGGIAYNLTLVDTKARNAMDTIRRLAGSQWYYRLNPDNTFTFTFWDLNAVADHFITANHYAKARFAVSDEDVRTRAYVYGARETRDANGLITQPRVKQVVEGWNFDAADPRDLFHVDRGITDNGTALRIGNAELAYRGAPSIDGEIELPDSNYSDYGYDIERLRPGDTLEFVTPLVYPIPVYDGDWFYDSTACYGGVWASQIRGPLVIAEVDYRGTSAVVRLTTRPAGVLEELVATNERTLLEGSA